MLELRALLQFDLVQRRLLLELLLYEIEIVCQVLPLLPQNLVLPFQLLDSLVLGIKLLFQLVLAPVLHFALRCRDCHALKNLAGHLPLLL